MTLSRFLRDYVYIPLGGNRAGAGRTYVNLLLTMLIGGLWHGASWMFVLWGGLHGALLAGERLLRRSSLAALALWRRFWMQVLLSLLTFTAVCFTWVFFRARDLARAFLLLRTMVGFHGFHGAWNVLSYRMGYFILGLTAVTLFLHQLLRNGSFRDLFEKIPWWGQGLLLGVMIFGIGISISTDNRAFIYFQF